MSLDVAPCSAIPHTRNEKDAFDYYCVVCRVFVQDWVPKFDDPPGSGQPERPRGMWGPKKD